MQRLILTLLAFLALGASAQAGGIVTPAEQRYIAYGANLPACDDPAVLARISDRFEQKEAEYWHSKLQIGRYDRIRQIGFRANGLSYIPRRYCAARGHLNDARRRPVLYAIGEDLGIIGWRFGVEWCVVGLDRNYAFAPSCGAVRPFVERNLGQKALRALY